MKQTKKFFLKPLTAVNAFNYEMELPIYDGVIIACQIDNTVIDLLTLYCEMYETTCKLVIKKDIDLADYITSYEDFKALNEVIEKAKYHIELAHQAAIASSYID
jgi:hypothetical protein